MTKDVYIEQFINNLCARIGTRLDEVESLTTENLFEDGIVKVLIKSYYDEDLNNIQRSKYSQLFIIDELRKSFKKVKPTEAVAESYELETWLDSAKRINKEVRFDCYKELLRREGKHNIIEQLDADTYKILDSCHDPRVLDRKWDRRGLVYGHVQSGKTANYIGLINRAFDAGYKIVIVLTGMTEDLRSQTQERIDSGVIGKNIGIGKQAIFKNLEKITPATTIVDDLSTNTRVLREQILSTDEKSVWVIKKNKAVLENLITWLDKQRINQKSDKINGVPFLIIDDEADNASIQSMSKKEYEQWEIGMDLDEIDFENLSEVQERQLNKAKENILKAINRNIRVALSLISHKSFVAYTATPYSVINQTKEDLSRETEINGKIYQIDENSDLFPEHFIIPIKPGNKYMGIERIFPTERDKKLPVVVDVTRKPYKEEVDVIFPSKRGEDYLFDNLPKSLEDAIIHFIISIIVRKYRKHEDYNTLLVHTSHLTKNADYVAKKIQDFIDKLLSCLIVNNGDYMIRFITTFEQIKNNSKNNLFKQYFGINNYEFPEKISTSDIISVLKDYVTKFEIVSYHSSKDPSLKHKNHDLSFKLKDSETSRKKYKNYIVVGGNRLSRGLTLEGLTTSYFVRSSTRQDSLYQMGRWFGYRVGYEDLVRIYMPNNQILWFEGVYKLEMDLRRDFEENNSDDIKIMPKDAIIKLAYHTDETMHIPASIRKKFPAICDPNKLRNTSKQLMSFYGATRINKIIYNKKIQLKNLELVKDLITTLSKDNNAVLFDMSKEHVPEIVKNHNVNYTNVNYSFILDFIDKYEAQDDIKVDIDSLRNFIFENRSEINFWSVVLVNRLNNPEIKNFKASFYDKDYKLVPQPQNISSVKRVAIDKNDKKELLSIKSILEGRQKDNIFDIIDKNNVMEFKGNEKEVAKKYRNLYKKPIMLIYPVEDTKRDLLFPLLYFIVPVIKGGKKVQYIVRNIRK